MQQPVSGPIIQLIGGSYFNFLHPEESEFFIEDIAHSLSQQCRFTGHTTSFYSIAQHSVGVSRIVPYPLAMYGLLHDAVEFVVGDMSSPLKSILPGYQDIESTCERVILDRFGIPREYYTPHKLPSVRIADLTMLATERRDLLPHHSGLMTLTDTETEEKYEEWAKPACPWGVLDGIQPLFPTIIPLAPADAKQAFLSRFHYLLGRAA